MKQYVIVHFIRPFPEAIFPRADWPIHLTILGPFGTKEDFMTIADHLKAVASTMKPISIKGSERKMFGRRNDVRATVVKRTPELHALHTALLNRLKPMIELKVPAHNGTGYSPHVSDRPNARLLPDHSALLDSLSLIELLDDRGIVLMSTELI